MSAAYELDVGSHLGNLLDLHHDQLVHLSQRYHRLNELISVRIGLADVPPGTCSRSNAFCLALPFVIGP